MEERVRVHLEEFERRMEEELGEGTTGDYHCFRTLRELNEEMEGEGHAPEARAAVLDSAAREMAESLLGKVSKAARRAYDSWKERSEITEEEFRELKEWLLFLEYRFRETCDELEHFRRSPGGVLLREETLERAKEGLIRFEQLLQTYLRLLELKLSSSKEEGKRL